MRLRLSAALPLALVLALSGAAPALASNFYFIQTTADGPGTCQPISGQPSFFKCDTLRAGINAANANPNGAEDGGDLVYLQAAGTYTVNSELTLADRTTIFGRGPRTTTVRSAGTSRVLTIPAGASANLWRVGVSGGRATEGGNILNQGELFVYNSRITGGTATAAGGGIANVAGQLILINSLVDNNTASPGGVGGGILSRSDLVAGPASLDVVNSTIAFNRAVSAEGSANGGGIAVMGSDSNDTVLSGVSIARNSILASGTAGLYVESANDEASLYGSLLGENKNAAGASSNCGGAGSVTDAGTAPGDIEDGNTCVLLEHRGVLGLSATLVDAGGDTEVLTIPSEGGAKNVVPSPCILGIDQRSATRPTGTCDAGAFQEGATAPPVSTDPFPEPPPIEQPPPTQPSQNPTPTPTPTPTATPTPVVNKTVVVEPVKGKVLVRLPGSNRFVELQAGQAIPTGSTIDTKKGTVELTAQPKAGKPPETAQFHDGVFTVTQQAGRTDLKLTEQLAPCAKRGARAAAKKPKSRRLWGDGKGSFRTVGRYSAATVRGTEWLVQDTCAGTLTRVKVGSVLVTHGRKRIIVRPGKPYLARAPR